MTRNDSFRCFVYFSVCGGKKKQKIMYKSAKNAGKSRLFNHVLSITVDLWSGQFFSLVISLKDMY